MKHNAKRILSAIVSITLMICIFSAYGESSSWDCPDCGRTGNTGNFCGGCACPAPWIETEQTSHPQSSRQAGNIVTFGHYEQDNDPSDGMEEIEWLVLDYDTTNHKALLLSRYGLDAVPYNTEFADITWEECTLRAWLNGEFLSKAFSTAEQSAILATVVGNNLGQEYSEWNTDGGNNTMDRIFLLSYAEANRYLGITPGSRNNTQSRTAPTAYAIAQGAPAGNGNQTTDGVPAGWWWLRSPGSLQYDAAIVNNDGSLRSINVSNGNCCIRPAFWLNLESGLPAALLLSKLAQEPTVIPAAELTPALTPTPTPTPAPTAAPTKKVLPRATAGEDGATLRRTPELKENIIASIHAHDEMTVVGKRGKFYYVLYQGQLGYVHQTIVQLINTDAATIRELGDDEIYTHDLGDGTAVTQLETKDSGSVLRSTPKADRGNSICSIHAKTLLDVYGKEKEWYYVCYEGQYGYVHSDTVLIVQIGAE